MKAEPESVDAPRLRALMGAPEMTRIVTRIHRRLASVGDPRGSVVINDPRDAERDGLGRILGVSLWSNRSLRIDLNQLEKCLQKAGICDCLEDAIEALAGPLVNPRGANLQERARYRDLIDAVRERDARPQIQRWLDDLYREGLLRRLAQSPEHAVFLLDQCMALAARLPADDLLYKELAAQITGDAHGLDPDKVLYAPALRLAARLADTRNWEDAEARRGIWRVLGVHLDDLTVSVLVHNLPVHAEGLLGESLSLHRRAGEPFRISLSHLLRHTIRFQATPVFICENPSVVHAAALRLGADSQPLVCLEGQPTTAARRLLDLLDQAGCALRVHCDFDWGGITIANLVMARRRVEPWRMNVADYASFTTGAPLNGTPVSPQWDRELGELMQRRELAVQEELAIPTLLKDLKKSDQ